MMNTFEFLPSGSHNPKFTIRPGAIFGKPMEFSRYYGRETDREALRAVTDEIMAEIGRLSGQEYVNIYAKAAKEQLLAAQPEPDTQLSMLAIATRAFSRSHCKIFTDG
jgi:1-acyl-sn-glycerol-3-phosphate acyltransferase